MRNYINMDFEGLQEIVARLIAGDRISVDVELNWRVIYKAIGYASLYVGLADKDGDRPIDQVTVSIFRAVKNPEFFAELEEMNLLKPDQTKGIYHVSDLTQFPLQIVIMTELEGDEYAAARAMIDGERARLEDIERLVEDYDKETDEIARSHKKVIMELVSEKNREKFFEAKRRQKEMTSSVLMEVVRPEINEEKKRDVFGYVQAGGMRIAFAASQFHQTAQDFKAEMEQNGYTVPEEAEV